jgi:gliding motility-associated-like protein
MKTIKGTWLHLLQLVVLILITTVSSAQLKADFTATPVTGCPPMVVSFKDSSAGNPLTWKWDLGNGTISFLQNPIATYFTPGTYDVKLLVTNAFGKDSIAKTQFVVVNALPVALFSASDSTGCFPLKVQFQDNSLPGSGTLEKWQWDFGDGTLSQERNPSHTYTSPGTFTVILRISNSNGCSGVITKTSLIKISDGVKAGFNFVSAAGCETPAPVTFSNETVGTGSINYLWDFGNGKTSTQVNPINTYNGGVYTVKLIATNSSGCSDTIVKPNAINIATIKAGFVSDDKVCAASNLVLTNTSTPSSYTSMKWDFGDGGTSTQTNPGRIYANAGTYKIRLIAFFGACSDTAEKTITVLAQPTAAFTGSNTSGCAGPLNVSFHDASINAVSYQWAFGDGATSNLQNPTHSYTSPGSYKVSLTVTSSLGCTNTAVKDNFVKFAPLKITSIENLGVKGCLPVTVSPVAVIAGDSLVGSYFWDFGDGSVSTSATPSHTYTTPGIYDVKLIVTAGTGCSDTLILKEAVKAGNRPVTKFDADPREVCALLPVNFSDLSTGAKVDQWLWYFGDGGTSTFQNPIYTYNDTGHFTVTLITASFGCSDTLKIEKFIYVKPPIAKFDTSYLCSDPLKRDFIDQSVDAKTWEWNFGDGSTSTSQNPSHTYSAPGVYAVMLTVTNDQCRHAMKKDVVVIKERGTLVVSDSISCLNTNITFTVKNIDEKNISNYNWYFNGLQGNVVVTVNNPLTWAFNEPGVRNATVILQDLLGCNDTINALIPITSYGPKASFVSLVPNTCYGNTINFSDSSKSDGIHPITEYLWDYGENGSKSYAAGPFSHDYAALGTYDIQLVVTDSYGCKDSLTRPGYVSITNPAAKFTASDTAFCPSLPITFTNTSQGANATYKWSFGDGTTSSTYSPVHAFVNPGSYKVTMVMVDVNGCTASDSTTVSVYSAKADFVMSDSFSTCPPLVVNITNKSSNYIDLNWDFGDGGNSQLTDPSHIYTYPGNYTVKVKVTNKGGCVDELTKKVSIEGPTGSFDYLPKEACNPGKVDYSITAINTESYVWDFNDGNTIFSVNPTISHTYINSGHYVPKVILKDGFGCQVPVQGLDTVKIYSISTNILSDTKMVCDSGIVAFRDSSASNDVVKSFLWSFGDGATSTERNPTHNFADTGHYSIKLVATTAFGCHDSTVSVNYVRVVHSPAIKILGDTSACEPAQIKFSGAFARIDTSAITWAWDFGNGVVSDKQQPDTLLSGNSGSYHVTLKATNSDGCVGVVSRTAVIHPVPVVDAGPNVGICRFDTYTLTASGADNYTWRANSTLSCANCATPVVKPDSLMTYYVTGKTVFGCSGDDSVTVKVQQPFKMAVAKADTVCKGETITLNADGADQYQWTPSVWINNSNISSPIARPDTTVTFQVIGQDSSGCFKDTANILIKVFPTPSIDITNGDNVNLQAGGTVKLTTKSSPDVITWKWLPAQWLSCGSCAEPVAAPKDRVTYSVIATNEGNCTATDKVNVNILCNDANVYLPNTFSPNADGVNDVFYTRGRGLFNIASFKVFNRWGQIVFQRKDGTANNPSDGWDGTLNGLPLQPDVYVYLVEVVCYNGTIFPFKGNVSLIR